MTKKYIPGDSCPECKKPMEFDPGEPMDFEHPGSASVVYCADCLVEYLIDYGRWSPYLNDD